MKTSFLWTLARGIYRSIHRFWRDIVLEQSPQKLWLFRTVRPYTLVKIPRLQTLYHVCETVEQEHVTGDIVECGVWNGGSAAVMAYASRASRPPRALHLFDSFQGLPLLTGKDGATAQKRWHPNYDLGFRHNVEKILFHKLRIPRERVHIYEGWFHETIPHASIPSIAVLHIDADLYEPTKFCLETFYPAVTDKGYVAIDDYESWEGCKSAVDEFLANHPHLILRDSGAGGRYFQSLYTSKYT